MTGWHLIDDDSWVQHYLHSHADSQQINSSFALTAPPLPSIFLCPPASCRWNLDFLSWSENFNHLTVCLADCPQFIPRCLSSSDRVKMPGNTCNACCGSSAGLCRNQPFNACQAPFCENSRAAPATCNGYTYLDSDFTHCFCSVRTAIQTR